MHQIFHLSEIPMIAKEILLSSKHKLIRIDGNMGVGKTTLIKAIGRQLNVKEVVNSPTFTIMNTYNRCCGCQMHHFDFYRINTKKEINELGIDDFFNSGAFCLLEWAEKIEAYLPDNIPRFKLSFQNNMEERKIQLTN